MKADRICPALNYCYVLGIHNFALSIHRIVIAYQYAAPHKTVIKVASGNTNELKKPIKPTLYYHPSNLSWNSARKNSIKLT